MDEALLADKPAERRRFVSLGFRSPKATGFARIRGSVDLHYFSGSQVIKLTNAIPARWIARHGGDSAELEPGKKSLTDPALARLGLKIGLDEGALERGAMTMIFMEINATRALRDVQVF